MCAALQGRVWAATAHASPATTAGEAAGGQPCAPRDSQPGLQLRPDARAGAPGCSRQEDEGLGGRKESESSAQPR